VRRSLPLLLAATGLALIVAGFVYDVAYAGIPYQDPTPEMATAYAHHARVASAIRLAGLGLVLLGGASGLVRRLAGVARRPAVR